MGNLTMAGIAFSSKDPSDGDSMTGKPFVATVADPTQNRPARWRQQPAETNGAISFAKNRQLADNASVGENAMDDTHKFLAGRMVNHRIKAWRTNIFEGEPAVAVTALQPARLAPAKRAFAII